MGGDGLLGAVAGELRGTDGVLGVLPGGRGNDFARKLGVGTDPGGACAVLAGGPRARASTSPTLDGRPFLGIASAGLDSDVQDIANATRLPLGAARLPLRHAARPRRWRPARWTVVVDGERTDSADTPSRWRTPGCTAAACAWRPHAALDDGLLDVVLTRDSPRRASSSPYRGCSAAPTSTIRALVLLRGREVAFAADRPFVAYADGDPIAALPATVRVAPRALRVLAP